ncbi:MAG: CoA pyrophosphatase [Devosia sp.]|uniref:CoA pyrophosphatase n=1 Tax=Devosia sp. TaxID=1871048 RepID=UPI001AD2A45A|nr:CoA pyrophosphatase [Devosia sp.]MBN9315626.1 CoA pyrophosphatase [Devosia sp.]
MQDENALIERISGRLLREPQPFDAGAGMLPDWVPEVPHNRPPVHAAVLIALVRRADGLSILYTERSPELRSHSGQIAFPGGKVDPTDIDAADAALREAWEEVRLDRSSARVLGYLPLYYTGTNYLITPVVAVVEPRAPFVPNPSEVRSVFEVPLSYLMAPGGFTTFRIQRNGREHSTWQIEHSGLVIWGITANLTRRFHDLALAPEGG